MEKVFIIAEIGVNHNGDLGLARELVRAAKAAGADAVKFQTFTAEALVGADVPKVPYQLDQTSHEESHFDMIKKLELSRPAHREIFDFCKQTGIEFLSTPYDVESAKFLNELGVRCFKTASADLVDTHLHEYLSTTNKKVYASVGMGTLGEIEKMLGIYERNGARGQVILLHCVSNYPCQPSSLHLRVIETLRQGFHLPIGYSDHAEGNLATTVAVSLGAVVVEKHFTIDKKLPGPDHKASCDPAEFKSLVRAIRETELILGDPVKRIQQEELDMRRVSRKSITLCRPIAAGQVIQASDLTLKRPGTGLYGEFEGAVVGKKARATLPVNHLIRLEDLE